MVLLSVIAAVSMVQLTSKFTNKRVYRIVTVEILNILECWARATQEIHCLQVIIYELKNLVSNSYYAVLYSRVITYEW